MTYPLNAWLDATAPPPIAEAKGWARDLPDGRPLLDLAQAVPSDPPPQALRDHMAEVVRQDAGHGYTDVLGRQAVRETFAEHIVAQYGGSVAPEQVALTAGCNQAFCYAMGAVARPGDEVILPTPYYFNHHMWLGMQGIRPVYLPADMAGGAVPSPAAAAELIGPNTRAIVLVTPNNPTGALYPPETLERFLDLARARGLALIVDETYKDFLPEPRAPHHLFRRSDWDTALIHLYSFSKAYSLTGHRMGGMAAAPGVLQAIAKMADCVAICPSVLGQAAAHHAMTHLGNHREAQRQKLAERIAALRAAFENPALNYELVSAGAYFAYVRHPFEGEPAMEVARRLVRDQHVLSLPGTMFGADQDRYLRFAFANLGSEVFPDMVERLIESQG
jgi:aspartate/methionine/tyrosine aminotransferase